MKLAITAVMLGSIGFLGGCNVDDIEKGASSIEEKAKELEKQIESSNLKDCKDEEGNPLPEWICKKGDPSAKK